MAYLSVVVPTHNSQPTIGKCLRAIRNSSYLDYELLIVDDASKDATVPVARKYADKIIELKHHLGRAKARSRGIRPAKGQIIVNIDSDVLIKPDTLSRIAEYLAGNPKIDAVTGILSKEHPNKDFFSQYKNLYMHYIFRRLPQKVTFLYGSIYAIKRKVFQAPDPDVSIATDTALGQKLISIGRRIVFLKSLEVVHLKKYNLSSFIKNDFQISFEWAHIFIRYRGWRQLGRYKTGYAHAPKSQLISIILAAGVFLWGGLQFSGPEKGVWLLLFLILWLCFNLGFINFLRKEKGFSFGATGLAITFFDNIIMGYGILFGSCNYAWRHFLLRK